nr:uncharacterized protein CG31750 [Drosophila virilis]
MLGNISEKSAGYNFYLETSIYCNVNYQCLRMIYLLHSWPISGAYVMVINKIMELHRNMCSTFDRSNFTLEHNILIISVVEFSLTLLQIWNQMMTSYILLVFVYHLVLFELFYWAYFLYQLILIAWHQVLLNLLSSYAGNRRPNKRDRHQLMLFYGFYFRMCAIHGHITQHWLKIAGGLFASIAILSADISEELFDIIYKQKSPLEKWKYFVVYKIGNCLTPIVKIFLLGLCNNRIEKLTKLLGQQIYLIELLHWKRSLDKLPSIKRKPFTSLLASKSVILDGAVGAVPIRVER